MFLDDENEETVVEDTTENTVEQTAEEKVEVNTTTEAQKPEGKVYTQDEVNQLIGAKINREREKQERKYQEKLDKYRRIETILGAGLQTENLDDMGDKLEAFYKNEGVEIPNHTELSERQVSLLGKGQADEIIAGGYDDIVEEVDRLASKGFENLTNVEKVEFQKLASERKRIESIKSLEKIGVGEKEIQDKDYQEFAKNLNPDMSEKDKYEMYLKYKPKNKVEPMGSMKNNTEKKDEVKDFYTFEEAKKFTRQDYLKNPKLMEAVEKSSQKWIQNRS